MPIVWTAPPYPLRQGTVGMDVGAYAVETGILDASTFVTELLELFPLFAALAVALPPVAVCSCCCACFCVAEETEEEFALDEELLVAVLVELEDTDDGGCGVVLG
jgi:hypothetical protein